MLECVQWSTSLVNQYLFANFSTMNMLHIYEFYSQLFDGGVGGREGGGVPSWADNRKLPMTCLYYSGWLDKWRTELVENIVNSVHDLNYGWD